MKTFGTTVIVSGLLFLSGCDKSAEKQGASVAAAKVNTADDVAKLLAKAALPVQNVTVLDAATDPNSLLGRPGQYTSKITFFDGRHPKPGDGSDTGENTIEVFSNAADAKTRHDYVEQVTKGMPMLTQYMLLQGKALVRFDKVMLPAEVDGYKAALAKINVD